VTLDTVEEWKNPQCDLRAADFPSFHIHLNPFQITEVFDPNATVVTANNGIMPKYVPKGQTVDDKSMRAGPLDQTTWKDCHNDTATRRASGGRLPHPVGATMSDSTAADVPVPGYFRMRSRFVDFPGNYVIHCTSWRTMIADDDRRAAQGRECARPDAVPSSLRRAIRVSDSRGGRPDDDSMPAAHDMFAFAGGEWPPCPPMTRGPSFERHRALPDGVRRRSGRHPRRQPRSRRRACWISAPAPDGSASLSWRRRRLCAVDLSLGMLREFACRGRHDLPLPRLAQADGSASPSPMRPSMPSC